MSLGTLWQADKSLDQVNYRTTPVTTENYAPTPDIPTALSLQVTALNSKQLTVTIVACGSPLQALINCGVSANFISKDTVKRLALQADPLTTPEVCGVDGNIIMEQDKEGYYSLHTLFRDIADMSLFCVIALLCYDLVLRYPWLEAHNPDINWKT